MNFRIILSVFNKNALFAILITIFIGSCEFNINKKSRRIENSTNEKLIGSKDEIIGEPDWKEGVGEYNFDLQKINIKYVDDIIIVKTKEQVNACLEHQMNILIKNDTIFLQYNIVVDRLCKSESVHELTYLIDNPKMKKLTIVK